MPLTYTQQASRKLSPAFNQQIGALKSQMPAIQSLYAALGQGLQGQQTAETQNMFENAGGRGLLRSTIPVDLQTGLQAAFMQKRGQMGAEQAQRLAAVRSAIGGVNVDRATAIANLANALKSSGLESKKFAWQKKQALRELQLKKDYQAREFALQQQLASLGIY